MSFLTEKSKYDISSIEREQNRSFLLEKEGKYGKIKTK